MTQSRGSLLPPSESKSGTTDVGLPIEPILTELQRRIDDPRRNRDNLIVFTFDLPTIDLIGWLQRADVFPKAYWQDREGSCEFAGIGQTMDVSPSQLGELRCDDEARDRLLIFGAERFDTAGDYTGHDWQNFPATWRQLPVLTLTRRFQSCSGTIVCSPEQELSAFINQIRTGLAALEASATAEFAPVTMRNRHDRPDRSEWNEGCRHILRDIETGAIEKAVLARRTELQFEGTIDPFALLRRLGGPGGQVYRFLLSPQDGTAFIGASPERLFRIEGDHLESEAVAGTVPRGQSGETDEQLARLLQESRKDNREHKFVVDGIVESLHPLTTALTVLSEPKIIKLQRVQHLASPIKARLNPGVTSTQVLSTLHPTAAVCGTPRDAAMLALRQLEPFDRGYYSGPLGIYQEARSEVAVALRSALVIGNTVNLYAGAGIVAGSDPDIEWLELEQKLQAVFELLTGSMS